MKEKSQSRETFIFGIHPVLEAIESGRVIDRVLFQKGMQGETFRSIRDRLYPLDIPFQTVPLEKLNRITRKNHQGVIAFISPVPYQPLEEVLTSVFEKGENPIFIMLDRITDVRNFGAIARTAECAGAHGIIIPKFNSVRLNADALKTSAGGLNHLPVCRVDDLDKAALYLQKSGLKIIACTEKTSTSYTEANLSVPVVLIMGSEEDGIGDSLLNIADQRAALPIKGRINSLNVSVATGIFLYEALRQRKESSEDES